MILSIYIGADRLDLYKDDNISLKSSLSEIEDISKVFTDSTNSFNVPATDNNNKIFKHFYNVKLVDGWDVFNKVDAIIELNGILYKQGKIKLNKVTLKGNIPTSYDVHFFGLLTSLKDLVGNDKLEALDMSAYNFNIDANTVIDKLIGVDTDKNIVNTPITNKRLVYDSDPNAFNMAEYDNVAYNGTSINSGLDWGKTYSSILNIRIIEAIEQKYGITFSRDYFGTNAFNNLYLLLNRKENVIEEQIVFDNSDDPTLENNRILLSSNLPPITTPTTSLLISINNDGATRRDEFTIKVKSDNEVIQEVTAVGNDAGQYAFYLDLSDTSKLKNLTFYVSSKSALDYRFGIVRYYSAVPFTSERYINGLSGIFNVSENLPDIKIIDYLKGLFQKDKLIAINTSNTDVYVDSLQQYYRKGQVIDITKYIDYDTLPISATKIYNQINYNFSEPKTLLQKQYFENNGYYYGDLEYELTNSLGKKIDGETIEIKLPFENMIYEKLNDLNGLDDVNFMYGLMQNESLDAVNVKAHLHYVERINLDSPIKIKESTNSIRVSYILNVPSHTLGFTSPQYSTVFGEEFNEYNGVKISNTIYTNYHKEFIENAFDSNRRLFVFKCKDLPIDFLVNLKLNDVLEIKDNFYQINKYNLNLITRECTFEVYNIKNLNLTPEESITTDSTLITVDTTLITADNNT